MVTKVYGTSDGVEIIFTPSGEGAWNCAVPIAEDGEYVVDLYAEDEAGNTSYCATVLFTIDAKHLRVEMKWLKLNTESSILPFGITAAMAPVEDTAQESKIMTAFSMSPVQMEVVKCEVCGRW